MKRALEAVLPPIPDTAGIPRVANHETTQPSGPTYRSGGTIAGPAQMPRIPARMPRASTAPVYGAPPMRVATPMYGPHPPIPTPYGLAAPRTSSDTTQVRPAPMPSLHPYALPPLRPAPQRAPQGPRQQTMQMRYAPAQSSPQVPITRCEVCKAPVGELRRGRCWGCYAKWVETRPVGLGARCVTCGDKRRRVLKNVELFGGWKPMCFNCAGQLLHLDPMPPTIAALRAAVSRERRANDRRAGKSDTRVFQYERRVGDRRVGRTTDEDNAIVMNQALADDMEIEISIDMPVALAEASGATAAATADDGVDFDDLTQIRMLVRDLRPE